MNSIRNGLGMRETQIVKEPTDRGIRISMRFSPKFITRSKAQWKGKLAMDQSSTITAGLDLGDRYGQLCLIDAESGDVIEEGRIPPPQGPPATFLRLSADARATEVGTHSPWG